MSGPRETYRTALVELARRDERVVCLDSDLGGLETTFGKAFPGRYVNVGIAEANMFSVAAGLAAGGYLPYVHTMATFATTRAAEQLKLDIVHNRLPVRVVATHGGLAAAHFGVTHYALEDLAVTRALDGLAVVVPSDSRQIATALSAVHALDGPSYLRLGRSATPDVPGGDAPFRLGRAALRRAGTDATVVACGPVPVLMALEAADTLAAEGIRVRVLDVPSLAPFDDEAVAAAARQTAGIVTVEEHRPTGGLGDAVAEVVGARAPCPVLRVAVRQSAPPVVQTHRRLLEESGVSAPAICAALRRLVSGRVQEGEE